MSAESKVKRGQAGVANANAVPFRLNGGDVQKPAFLTPETRLAKNGVVGLTDYRQTSNYMTGMIGGVIAARLGFGFPGDESYEQYLAAA